MRGAIESAAPWRRPRLDRMQTSSELLRPPGKFTSPPLRRPRAFRRADHRGTIQLPSSYHPTDPWALLGRSWSALGPLLGRSCAIFGALGALPASHFVRRSRNLATWARFSQILSIFKRFGVHLGSPNMSIFAIFRWSFALAGLFARRGDDLRKTYKNTRFL